MYPFPFPPPHSNSLLYLSKSSYFTAELKLSGFLHSIPLKKLGQYRYLSPKLSAIEKSNRASFYTSNSYSELPSLSKN